MTPLRKKKIIEAKKKGRTLLKRRIDEVDVFIPTTKGVVFIGTAKNDSQARKIGSVELKRLRDKGQIRGVKI